MDYMLSFLLFILETGLDRLYREKLIVKYGIIDSALFRRLGRVPIN